MGAAPEAPHPPTVPPSASTPHNTGCVPAGTFRAPQEDHLASAVSERGVGPSTSTLVLRKVKTKGNPPGSWLAAHVADGRAPRRPRGPHAPRTWLMCTADTCAEQTDEWLGELGSDLQGPMESCCFFLVATIFWATGGRETEEPV